MKTRLENKIPYNFTNCGLNDTKITGVDSMLSVFSIANGTLHLSRDEANMKTTLRKKTSYTFINCGYNEIKITGDIQLIVSGVSLSQWGYHTSHVTNLT